MEPAKTDGATASDNETTSIFISEIERELARERARERWEMELADKYDEGERIGIEKGEKKGIIDSVVKVLVIRFGTDEDELRLALQNKSLEELRELRDYSVVCESVADFLTKLES